MKLFKNPVFAVILTIVVVIASTLINTNIKFGRKCAEVVDLFYEGTQRDGVPQPSISSHLENICGYTDGLCTIARSYDVDTEEVETDNNFLLASMKYFRSDLWYVRSCYDDLCSSVGKLIDQLERCELSERDASGVSQYKSSIAGAQSAIGESGYNDAVRSFLRKYDHFPTSFLSSLAGVDWPRTFS